MARFWSCPAGRNGHCCLNTSNPETHPCRLLTNIIKMYCGGDDDLLKAVRINPEEIVQPLELIVNEVLNLPHFPQRLPLN